MKTTYAAAVANAPTAGPLTASQVTRSAGFGLVFWFLGAKFVEYGAPAGLLGGWASAILFLLTVPIGFVTVKGLKKFADLNGGQVLYGVLAGSVAATFCDGIAMTWQPSLYGSSAEQVLPGAAWILWGAGCILLAAYLESSRAGSRE